MEPSHIAICDNITLIKLSMNGFYMHPFFTMPFFTGDISGGYSFKVVCLGKKCFRRRICGTGGWLLGNTAQVMKHTRQGCWTDKYVIFIMLIATNIPDVSSPSVNVPRMAEHHE
jgi:hypothetical protein